MRWKFALALGIVLAGLSPPVQAVPLIPGSTVFPDNQAIVVGGGAGQFTIVGATQNLAVASNPAGFTGTFTQTVFRNNTSGQLTFAYAFANAANSLSSVDDVGIVGFRGFTTDVGYLGASSGAIPFTANRSLGIVDGGNVIGFHWENTPVGNGRIDPGQTSRVFIVNTNAVTFTTGTAVVQNGVNAELANVYIPLAIAPEPGSLVLAAIGLPFAGALCGRRWFRRKPTK